MQSNEQGKKTINVLSLFDGISCGQIALERAGIPVANYFASEIDEHCIKVAQQNYPRTIQLGDVQKVSAYDLPEIDLLLGGSPCQGFSVAGFRLGFDDPRSKLFFHYIRLKRALNPTWFLLENVSMSKTFVDIISEHMEVQPVIMNSIKFSAQRRRRLYWTNIPFIVPEEDHPQTFSDILEYGHTDKKKAFAVVSAYSNKYPSPCDIGRFENKSIHNFALDPNGKHGYRKLTPIECERLQTVPDNYTSGVTDTERYRMLGNGWTVDAVAHILKGINNA